MKLSVIAGTYDGGLVVVDVSCSNISKNGEDCFLASPAEAKFAIKFAYNPHQSCVSAVACQGNTLVTASTDETIRTFDINEGREISNVTLDTASFEESPKEKDYLGRVSALDVGKDPKGKSLLITGHRNGQVAVWDLDKLEIIRRTTSSEKGQITGVAVPKNAQVALATCQKSLLLINVVRGTVASNVSFSGATGDVCCNPSGQVSAFTCGESIYLLKMATAASHQVAFSRLLPEGQKAKPAALSFVTDTVLVIGDSFGRVGVFDIDSEFKVTNRCQLDLPTNRRLKCVVPVGASESQGIVTVDNEGTICILSLSKAGLSLVATHAIDARIVSVAVHSEE